MNENKLQLDYQGTLPQAAIDAVADLLLSTEPACELCSLRPAEHYIDQHPQWAGRHVCTQCFESLETE